MQVCYSVLPGFTGFVSLSLNEGQVMGMSFSDLLLLGRPAPPLTGAAAYVGCEAIVNSPLKLMLL